MPDKRQKSGSSLPWDPETRVSKVPDKSPRYIGRYKLLQRIGRGGMGSVWMAEQEEPVRRRVALKVIRADMDSKEAVARFEAERQALAIMNHQNIAKVLDAGTTEANHPFFVMELVKGVKITKYCNENKLPVKERLRLFIPICQAVQHAHQKGILHRDIKPSNVLVSQYEGKPVPKVIDFGLAKALEHATKLTDRTMVTQIGKVVGTIQYMSPEQANAHSMDVDTRTDIYSLGVLLYELLTGTTPVERETLDSNSVYQVLEMIREKEPPRPSTRLVHSKIDSLSSVSQQRKLTPQKLKQILQGELDCIIMKALEIDRNRRYESATAFADDIQRYLNGEAVLARPPSRSYKFRKFVTKNRTAVVTMATVATLLAAGTIVSTLFWWNAENARAAADLAATRSENALEILKESFESVDPDFGGGADMPAKDLLFITLKKLNGSDLDDLSKASMLHTLSNSFIGLGEVQTAKTTADRAYEIRKQSLGDDNPLTLISAAQKAFALGHAGKIKEAIKSLEAITLQMANHFQPNDEELLKANDTLGSLYFLDDRADEAVELLDRSLEIRTDKYGTEHKKTIEAIARLAEANYKTGKWDAAIELNDQALAIMDRMVKDKRLPADYPERLTTLNNQGMFLSDRGHLQKADDIFHKLLPEIEKKLGERHVLFITALGNHGNVCRRMHTLDEAIELCDRSLTLGRQHLPALHPATLEAMNNLALCYIADERIDDATKLLEGATAGMEKNMSADHTDLLIIIANVGFLHAKAGDYDTTVKMLEPLVELMDDDRQEKQWVLSSLGSSYWRTGQRDKGLEMQLRSLENMLTTTPDAAETKTAMENLATMYFESNQLEVAMPYYEELVEDSVNFPTLRRCRAKLRNCYKRLKMFDELAEQAEVDVENARRELKTDPAAFCDELERIAIELFSCKLHDTAFKFSEENLELRNVNEEGSWQSFNARSIHGAAYLKLGKFEESKPLLDEGYAGLERLQSEIPDNKKVCITQTLKRLLALAKATGDKEAIAKWDAKLK